MEDRKTIFDYLSGALVEFGITVVILSLFCRLFGEGAKDISSIFQFGDKGLAVSTIMEFLLVSFVITGLRFLFFSDVIIRRMSVTGRTAGMIFCVIVLIGICSYLFSWFPVDEWLPWAMFLLSFFICFVFGCLVTAWKERVENRALERALRKMQEERDGE